MCFLGSTLLEHYFFKARLWKYGLGYGHIDQDDQDDDISISHVLGVTSTQPNKH